MGQSVLVNLPANSVTIADVGGYLDADTDSTGVTFSVFARQNEGVATVWASSIL